MSEPREPIRVLPVDQPAAMISAGRAPSGDYAIIRVDQGGRVTIDDYSVERIAVRVVELLRQETSAEPLPPLDGE